MADGSPYSHDILVATEKIFKELYFESRVFENNLSIPRRLSSSYASWGIILNMLLYYFKNCTLVKNSFPRWRVLSESWRTRDQIDAAGYVVILAVSWQNNTVGLHWLLLLLLHGHEY